MNNYFVNVGWSSEIIVLQLVSNDGTSNSIFAWIAFYQ